MNQNKSFNEDINLGILPLFNIPFNINYKSWGNINILSKDKFEVHNCLFSEDIKYLSVFIENSNIAHINIIFNDTDKATQSFTDSKMMNGNIKRVYVNGKEYQFNPFSHIPSFYFDAQVLPKVYETNKKGEKILDSRINVIFPAKTNTQIRNIYESRVTRHTGIEYEDPGFRAITLDIETYFEKVKTNKSMYDDHKLLCICFFDGVKQFKFYRGDYQSENTMLKACFDKLLDIKYKDHAV